MQKYLKIANYQQIKLSIYYGIIFEKTSI